MYGSVTDNEIAESISKWLTQASLRTQRERYTMFYFKRFFKTYIYIYIYIYIYKILIILNNEIDMVKI